MVVRKVVQKQGDMLQLSFNLASPMHAEHMQWDSHLFTREWSACAKASQYSSIFCAPIAGAVIMPPRKVPTDDVLRDLYAQGMSSREIAEQLHLKLPTVASALSRLHISVRTPEETKALQ
jgi:hypothetical protein